MEISTHSGVRGKGISGRTFSPAIFGIDFLSVRQCRVSPYLAGRSACLKHRAAPVVRLGICHDRPRFGKERHSEPQQSVRSFYVGQAVESHLGKVDLPRRTSRRLRMSFMRLLIKPPFTHLLRHAGHRVTDLARLVRCSALTCLRFRCYLSHLIRGLPLARNLAKAKSRVVGSRGERCPLRVRHPEHQLSRRKSARRVSKSSERSMTTCSKGTPPKSWQIAPKPV
jgi:hypothetical protein